MLERGTFMRNQSNAVASAGRVAGVHQVLVVGEDWRLARETHKSLQTLGMPRTNLLLVATGGVIRIVMEMLWLELREPIVTWRPGERLELPTPGGAATAVLHDVSELTPDDQHHLLRWIDQVAGEIRVVSTTAVPLWPRVKTGAFNEALYYRLNTVCIDIGG